MFKSLEVTRSYQDMDIDKDKDDNIIPRGKEKRKGDIIRLYLYSDRNRLYLHRDRNRLYLH
jgi:hypothetical protein